MRVAHLLILATAAAALCAMPMGRGASEAVASSGVGNAHVDPIDATDLLSIHNRERERLGLSPLRWNPKLAQDAGERALQLARARQLVHSGGGGDLGENLWMGTQGAWSVGQMVGFFLAERRNFRDARFPYVSRTGNWADVGHYTQIVWQDTREVGCGVATANQVDVLVCRYYPAGNVVGRSPY